MMFKTLITCAALAAFVAVAPAQEEKKAAAKKAPAASGILQPQMKVAADAGTYEKPMGTMGEKADNVWSATTTAAGVDGKPLPGKAAKVTGEIVDLSCYLQLGKHGEKHVACGKKCLTAGQPIGLLAKDGTVYMLMEEEHDPRRDGQTASFRKAATDHLGHIMEVTGTESMVRGYRAIYVQGYVNK
jgi:hypothetical protein